MANVATVDATFAISSIGFVGTVVVVSVPSTVISVDGKAAITSATVSFADAANTTTLLTVGVGSTVMVPGVTELTSFALDVLVEGDEVTVPIVGVHSTSGAVLPANISVKITDAGQDVLTTN